MAVSILNSEQTWPDNIATSILRRRFPQSISFGNDVREPNLPQAPRTSNAIHALEIRERASQRPPSIELMP